VQRAGGQHRVGDGGALGAGIGAGEEIILAGLSP
jgi:hypothetical protein